MDEADMVSVALGGDETGTKRPCHGALIALLGNYGISNMKWQ